MSDDGYHAGAYSPYSDFDDLLYDADPELDLADELAANAVHSPVYDDVPGNELDESFSDWDYYSDDYYDDDPTILNARPQNAKPKSSRSRPSTETATPSRGKKRKLGEVQDIQANDLGQRKALRDCMRGTVWAKPIPERENVFVPGHTEKVALLKDWKRVFGVTSIQDKRVLKLPHGPEDESWANNMSLADMGLQSEQSTLVRATGAEKSTGHNNEQGEVVEIDDETRTSLIKQLESMEEGQAVAFMQQIRSQFGIQLPSAADDRMARLQQLAREGTSPARDADGRELQSNRFGKGEVENNKDASTAASTAAPMPEISGSSSSAGHVKKRKASVSPSPESSSPERAQARSSCGGRSRRKRVASSVRGSSTETREMEEGGNTAARSSRGRKKQEASLP